MAAPGQLVIDQLYLSMVRATQRARARLRPPRNRRRIARSVPEPQHDDFVFASMVVDEVRIGSEKNAAHAGKPRSDPCMRLNLHQLQYCSDAGFDLRGSRRRAFRHVFERFIDLLKGAFRIAQLHRRYLESTASTSASDANSPRAISDRASFRSASSSCVSSIMSSSSPA